MKTLSKIKVTAILIETGVPGTVFEWMEKIQREVKTKERNETRRGKYFLEYKTYFGGTLLDYFFQRNQNKFLLLDIFSNN